MINIDTFFRFLYEFLSQFFNGLLDIGLGIFNGVVKMFNVPAYITIIKDYKGDFNGPEWILVVVAIIVLVVMLGLIFFLAFLAIRKYMRIRKSLVEQEELLDEVGELNEQVAKLMKEKDELYAMRVSQLGLKRTDTGAGTGEDQAEEGDFVNQDEAIRFPKLVDVDLQFQNYKIKDYGNTFTLPELVELFRNFAASKLGLYYKSDMIKLFIASLASTKLVILQGISGTGKTSLAYAWGKFLKHDSCIASVQPSWRDRTELFGYFNEFTKKFNETEVLKEMYVAGYTDDIYTIILDEMNISRVEYYFAEMLSILEMPNHDEWIVEIVPSAWKNDPKHLFEGKMKIPENIWYIGTINNDDSTFMVTDKVYDRAMPIDINDKGEVFEAEEVEAQDINFSYLNDLFQTAIKSNPISDDSLDKVNKMDDYVIVHFRIAFGNRIVAHMRKFVPVYVACGGDEIDGIDYFIARKILRKFEQLNIAYIKDEIDNFIKFLNDTFGENKMHECIEYLLRLKKMG